ncbi:NADH:flavin oxidoreductase/NADH oxidase [Corallococcus sp. AB004]|uniref:NADH:flavin oxidoreductase/NADH oxidase n=1 Tax=Corallococcus exiguus TaxID=83462 RepID=UPI000EA37F80|nr:NADH:flavin oxidoreductase/NADH oxidase [Corallococcus exiguus]NPC68795.1 NADH:flavin oxidoreductase/NADH oxidase [Corallococcus exiguus]NPD22779.1 NADH:flavin oxidoreductase/NADH oxidase [Corallococcus exiguus]RKI50162.1 NADH:flavin oxidoreductase/NADH oxidase [Corallococcus sp. AB004]
MSSKLFSPLKLRDITLRNRVVVSPMCQYSSEDGFANEWHVVHLGSRAVGGAGLVVTEATAVEPEGRISPQDLGLWQDAHVEQLARINRFMHQNGAASGVQLAHAGRKASTPRPWDAGKRVEPEHGGWQVLGPTTEAFEEGYPVPTALDEAGIQRIVKAFADAAVRAKAAGFQVIELHAAHGYLLHEFLSPLSNKRTDKYGGTFENRTRFALEVTRAVRAKWPESLPLFMRVSSTDWVEGGWTPEDSVALARLVAKEGVDLMDCSSGGVVPYAKIPVGPGYQTQLSEQVRKETGLLTGAVGMIRSAYQAEHILATGQADVVFLARELLRDPYWPLRAAKELRADVLWPHQYERAKN